MIASGDDLDPLCEQFLNDTRGDAETGGGILTVGDAQIDLALGQNIAEALVNDAPAGEPTMSPMKKIFNGVVLPDEEPLGSRCSLGAHDARRVVRSGSTSPCVARP